MKRYMAKKITQEEFLKRVIELHGDEIDFSESVYVNDATNVVCKCKKCGNTWQATPNNLKNGKGCPKCKHKSRRYTLDEWFKIAKEKHNDNYDLSLVKEYHSREQKMEIICKKHGVFRISSNSFLSGRGCPFCAVNTIKEKQRKPFVQMVNDARKVHGDKYIYDENSYVNARTPMKIFCKIHGEFQQTPHKHINGKHGCPQCNASHLEEEISSFLIKNNIKYVQYYRSKWLGLQSLDFYLPQYDIAIECQGEQHYEPIKQFGGNNEYLKIKERDQRKKQLCEENGVKLLYYTHYKNVDEDNLTFKDCNKLLNEVEKYEL